MSIGWLSFASRKTLFLEDAVKEWGTEMALAFFKGRFLDFRSVVIIS